jgi:hypothetical protein
MSDCCKKVAEDFIMSMFASHRSNRQLYNEYAESMNLKGSELFMGPTGFLLMQLNYEASNAAICLYEKYKSLGLLSDEFINNQGAIIEQMKPSLSSTKQIIDKAKGNKTVES